MTPIDWIRRTADRLPQPSGAMRGAGLAIGLVLLAAAVYAIVRNRGALGGALDAVQSPDPLSVALLLGLIVVNIVLSSVFFHLLMSRFGRVGRGEMLAVIAATTLLNYLPLRPGLLGRVAYHKTANGIRVRDTARAVIESLLITMSLAGYLALGVVVVSRIAPDSKALFWIVVIIPVPMLCLFGALARRQRVLLWAASVRHLELLLWAARYALAFSLLGYSIDATTATAFACAGVVTMMVPLVSNGLGLREWAVGLLAPLLADLPLELGLAAELINRAGEIIVVVACGLVGMVYLSRLRRRRGATTSSVSPDGYTDSG